MSAILINGMDWKGICSGCDFCASHVFNVADDEIEFYCTRTEKDITDNVLEGTKHPDCPLSHNVGADEIPWKTGTPEKAGLYLLKFNDHSYDVELWVDGEWHMLDDGNIEGWILLEAREG